MKAEYDKLICELADKQGYERQSNMLMEECAELIQAINKHKRLCNHDRSIDKTWTELVDDVMEEIADVEIMIEQVKYLLNINPRYIDMIKEAKIDRQIKRMEE